MDLASRKGFLADSGTTLMKVFWGLVLLAVLVPHANAAGMCLSVGGPLYGGATLATVSFEGGCPVGLYSNVGNDGAIITTIPNTLPSDLSQLTTATLGYSDPTGTVNTASASLDSGKLGAFDFGSLTGGNNGPGTALIDVVHFQVSDTQNQVPIGINMHLHGSESGGGSFANNFFLSFGGSLQYGMANPNLFYVYSLSGWGSPALTNESAGGFDFSGTIDVTNGEALQLEMGLALNCVSGETCDFSHTAALSFTLPSDVTFTSDSGVLLTQTGGSGVPEPASFALMGIGLVALAVFRKRGIYRRGSD
jgi:hypothetical protein